MQQVKLSPKYGYSILAAYRFFPLYQAEFTTLREAHQVRGVNEQSGVKGKLQQLHRYAVPLLAQAIRLYITIPMGMLER